MFRTSHIRSKLAVALAIPLGALVAIAGFEVYTAAQDVKTTRSQTAASPSTLFTSKPANERSADFSFALWQLMQ